MKKIRAAVLCAALLCAAALTAAAAPLSIEDLVKMGTAGNLDLQKARQALQDAREDLPWKTGLLDTKLDLSGGYGLTSGEVTGQARISVPVIPQVSVDASVTSAGDGSASVKVSPFAQGDAKYLLEKAYQAAALALSYAERKLAADIEGAACAELQARRALDLSKARLALQEEKTVAAESSYLLGRLSYTDLDSQRSALITARQGVFDAERGLLSARISLYRLLGASEAEVKDADAAEMDERISARDAEIGKLASAEPGTLALRQAVIELSALRQELAQTWAYRPSLSLGASLAWQPASPNPISASASVSFSFSPSDIKTEDRAEISRSIAEKEKEVAMEQEAGRFQRDILTQALSVARETLTARKAELAQAETTAAQGEVLLSQGRGTSLELEQARLNVDSARAGVLSAAAAVLSAQAQVLLLFGT